MKTRYMIIRMGNYLLNKSWILNFVMRFLNEDQKERILISKFRAELEFWGHDTSNMTDEEIKEGVKNIGKTFSAIGFTVKEASDALRELSRVMSKTKTVFKKATL